MTRCLSGLTLFGLLVGCVAAPRPRAAPLAPESSTLLASDASATGSLETADLVASSGYSLADAWRPDAAYAPDRFALAPEPFAQRAGEARRPPSGDYVMLKGGWLEPEESDFDTGYAFNAAFGHYINPILAVEFEGGYQSLDGNGSSADLYALPMLVNARVCVPIWLLEIYGGAGMGTTYYDLDTNVVDATGWLFTGDLFVGADIELFDKLTAGVELKYYMTERLRDTSSHLNALAAMVTVGWRF